MKKFMLMTVAAFCMFLAACSGGVPSPTGDAAKDAKAVLDYSIEMMSNIKDEASIKDFETKMEALQKEFDAYYKDPEAKAKFEEEGKKLTESPEYKKKMEEATQKMMEVALKSLK
jgi:ABC-type glycerol-3-phosphate transport system substrate-binding protein